MASEPFPKARGLYHPRNEHDSCGIGFVAHIKGQPSHDIIRRGLDVLLNMNHRGATSADNSTGDGAGILIQIPHRFISKTLGIDAGLPGRYATGLVFLPTREKEASLCLDVLNRHIREEGLELIGYREVPVDHAAPGKIARTTEPTIKQVFVRSQLEQDALERKLFVVRKLTEHTVRNSSLSQKRWFYQPSFSSKTLIYKGMFTPQQLIDYFPDLSDEDLTSAVALVHSRFSTNTFPTWDLAQPFRIIAHNGEINTIRGNRLWMHAREALMKSDFFGNDLQKLLPILEPGKSDSASFDNTLEFLHLAGRSLPHVLCMMVPESFNEKNPIPGSLKAFYEYHSTIMEPWDGPASILFSDGRTIGGTLDRNGLRPSRYVITNNDLIVMASETGVQTFAPSEIREKGRLRPGKLLLVDTQLGIIIPDREVKDQLSKRSPYEMWLKENRMCLEDIDVRQRVPYHLDNFDQHAGIFGYSREDLHEVIRPMAVTAAEPTHSMGNDTPIPLFSLKPRLFYDYFRQSFAQVTNPPIDSIRESLVMSLTNYIGGLNSNILMETPEHCRLIKFESPLIINTDLGKIKDLKDEMFVHRIIPMVFKVSDGFEGFRIAFEKLLTEAEKAVDEKKNYIILSDRQVSSEYAPIPSLLTVAAVHHHLIRVRKRMQVGIIVETGDAREVNHYALLLAFGASVINPYLAFAAIDQLVKEGYIGIEYKEARKNYMKAVDKGLLKIFSKMGISTLRSYHGSQVYEAVGVSRELIDRHFTGTPSRIGGIGLEEIWRETMMLHEGAFRGISGGGTSRFESTGSHAWRKYGEHHAWNPEIIGLLQWSTRSNDYSKFKEFTALADRENSRPFFVRGCFTVKKNPIPIEEVEAEEEIMKRFVTGAMSYGSISREAHEALAIAMNSIGGRSNTGEGGEDSSRFGTNRQSAIKQVASGRFGVTVNFLVHADELQIKIAQGAKPGEGGQLPGYKVNEIIARTRNSTPGITLISPPPHHDIYSIEDLAQLIYDLKSANPGARVSVKLVAEDGVGTIAAGVAKACADLITISGGEGGTGASPLSSIRHAGLPAEFGIAEAQQTLVMNQLRGRVRLQVDGQLRTGRDVIIMGCLGAEEFGFATAALVVLGCVMMRKCHLNTCPAGVATQDPVLRKRFLGRSEYAISYFRFLAREIREYLAEAGFRSFDDIVGRADLLEINPGIPHWKMKNADFSSFLHMPARPGEADLRCTATTIRTIGEHPDKTLLRESAQALKGKEKVWISQTITNVDRAAGAMLSGEIARRYGEEGLPDDTITCLFRGTAGQSFGAFLAKGVTFRIEGDANDYFGKGLSGGRLIITPPPGSSFTPEENIIIGNTSLYGATSGEAYIRGVAGERFCVRNSGARAVVEGTGDHGCEYMTGGRVVILGPTGRNFAAGMSGGIAYVLDKDRNFEYFCNKGLAELLPVEERPDILELQELISNHLLYTQSSLAAKILTEWEAFLPLFVKVIPLEYKKVLEEEKLRELERKLSLTEENPIIHE